FEASQRQRDWSDAVAEITQVLLKGEDESAALGLVARRVAALSRASEGLVAMVDEWGDLRVRADTRSDGRVRPLTDSAVLKAPMWSEMLSAKQPILFAPDDGSDMASW